MSTTAVTPKTPTARIAIFGSDGSSGDPRHGCGLWAAGYEAILTAAGAIPVPFSTTAESRPWDDVLEEIDGVLFSYYATPTPRQATGGEALCRWCQKNGMPLLAVDDGLLLLNTALGGSLYTDHPRELPEALQHRHPPERGLRHAINVAADSRMARLYGDGEIIVNSEHRKSVQKLGRGLTVSARALDGVVEAVEAEKESWFCLGVQWLPASGTASGLDIQLFRGLITAAEERAAALFHRMAMAA